MTNTADLTDVSDRVGFILDEARKLKRSMVHDGVLWTVLSFSMSIAILPFFIIGDHSISYRDMACFLAAATFIIGPVITALMHEYTVDMFSTAKLGYQKISDRAERCGQDEYISACSDLSNGANLGGIYCGREWIYSPHGLLYRWDEVQVIAVKFFFAGGYRDSRTFRLAVIHIRLNTDETVKFEIVRDDEIVTFNDSFDDFAELAKSRRIAVSRKFTKT